MFARPLSGRRRAWAAQRHEARLRKRRTNHGILLSGVGRMMVVAGIFFSAGCGRRQAPTVERSGIVMGTTFRVTLPSDAAERLPEAFELVEQVFRGIERTFSIYDPDSALSRVNDAAGGDPITTPPEVAALCSQAIDFARRTNGAFDPTVGPLMTLWGFGGSATAHAPPSPEDIRETLISVGWRHVEIDIDQSLVRLNRPGMRIDLGGVAKGYAIDQAVDALRANDFENILVDLGGELRGLGTPNTARSAWRIGVRHPLDPKRIIGSLDLKHGESVSTSGHYERFMMLDGVRYAHIIDPREGRPVQGMAGVTVIAASATEADLVSTALFVMGLEAGTAWLKERPEYDALLVPDRQPLEIHFTVGMAERFRPISSGSHMARIIEEGNGH